MGIEQRDIAFIEHRGSSVSEVERQLKQLLRGTEAPELVAPCVVGDGILKLSESQKSHYGNLAESRLTRNQLARFIPASGAASRMFKHLLNHAEGKPDKLSVDFLDQLEYFPFWPMVEDILRRRGLNSDPGLVKAYPDTLWEILFRDLSFSQLPKGLIPFHLYGTRARTAFEEQLRESFHYLQDQSGVYTHFTVTGAQLKLIRESLTAIQDRLQAEGLEASYSLSVQQSSTDTIAIDPNGEPFRDERGELLFRPGGHGALLHNLNALSQDLIYIKNIDNVVPDHLKEEALSFKKILAGIALDIQERAAHWLERLASDESIDQQELHAFIREVLGVKEEGYLSSEDAIRVIDRPIRVCGMVRNQGEPGGGPFWVRMSDGRVRAQIIEKAQVNLEDPKQRAILESATHFNPVDIVALTRKPGGQKANLCDYVEHNWTFISEKSYEGRPLKALEHPGLWNGGMAWWNTIFVEVPLESFNPVKTVNDLLRPAHRAILEQP